MKKILGIAIAVVAVTSGYAAGSYYFAGNETVTLTSDSVASAEVSVADVENLQVAEIGNKSVTLKWDKVQDATGYLVMYGTKSVADNEEYNRPAIETANVDTYKVDNLANGVTYYFSVIASDGSSYSQYYSDEVSAAPSAEGATAAPTITKVESVSSISFKITFSKPMNFPTDMKSAITVTRAFDETPLTLQSVTANDSTSITVITGEQSEGSEYRMILSDQFKDTNGVPLDVNERGDVFIGFAGAALDGMGASGASDLMIKEAIVPKNDWVEVVFSKAIKLGAKPLDQVAVVETNNPEKSLEVKDVIPNSEEANKVLVVTGPQTTGTSYTLLFAGITDESGSPLSTENSTYQFNGFDPNGATQAPTPTDSANTDEVPADDSALPDTGPGGLIALLAASASAGRLFTRKRK